MYVAANVQRLLLCSAANLGNDEVVRAGHYAGQQEPIDHP